VLASAVRKFGESSARDADCGAESECNIKVDSGDMNILEARDTVAGFLKQSFPLVCSIEVGDRAASTSADAYSAADPTAIVEAEYTELALTFENKRCIVLLAATIILFCIIKIIVQDAWKFH
jgi:hypothetical protein